MITKQNMEDFLNGLDHEPTDDHWEGWHNAIECMRKFLKSEARP